MGGDCREGDICDTTPRFVNVTPGDENHRDFSLGASSPAIDHGRNLSAEFGFDKDFGGTARPQGDGWHIGAFER